MKYLHFSGILKCGILKSISLLVLDWSNKMDEKDKNRKKSLPIGFMDSGLGGISVLQEAVKLMPNEDFIYYGDSLNAPYGTKEPEVIRKLTFSVVDKLLGCGIKGLAVACNTATSAAVKQLRIEYPDLPLVGIEPAIKPAVVKNHGGEIVVMATPMTIKQEKFHNLLRMYEKDAVIIPIECDGLMEFVESGNLEGEFLKKYFMEHLEPHLSDKVETIVLGCTHYPFLRPYLRKYLGKRRIEIIDGSYGTARELKRRIEEKSLLSSEKKEGKIVFKNSNPDENIIKLSWKLLRLPIN